MARVLILFIALIFSLPAHAHSMRAFAKISNGQIAGYAFFIGGGRPVNVDWFAKMNGDIIASGKTGPEGEYSFAIPKTVTADINITVDTREGHIATAKLAQQRLDSHVAANEPVTNKTKDTTSKSGGSSGSSSEDSVNGTKNNDVTGSTTAENRQVQIYIEEAIEQQMGPLLERIEEMDSRMRLTDIMSGIFLIVGLAGIGLWARSRKK